MQRDILILTLPFSAISPKLSIISHLVEVVNDDTDEEVHHQVRPNQHEQHEEPHARDVLVPDRLHIFVSGVDGSIHHVCPRLRGRYLEKGQQRLGHVVELLRDRLVPR